MKKVLSVVLMLVMVLSLAACGSKKCKHEFGDWRTVKKATCFETGEKTRKCTLCGEEETEVIPKTDGDPGYQLSDYQIKGRIEQCIKEKYVGGKTTRGYDIYSVYIATIDSDATRGLFTDTDIYASFKVYGTFRYGGTDKYGHSGNGSSNFEEIVKVYKWSRNPDSYREAYILPTS